MEIILLQDIENLGDKHELITVKSGYGRNYLIPQGMAIIANKTNLAKLNHLRKQDGLRESKKVGEYQEMANKIQTEVLKIGAKAGTSGKIFGSVTNIQIAQVIKDTLGLEVDRKKITIQEEVKNLGTYQANINFHPEVSCVVNFEVIEE
ncbi:MAG: 50S ribosomal protein L9 [Saprospirales bacterium]|nr:MAG: 50S ribosomal protein L9 [Saprospirales bacterium]